MLLRLPYSENLKSEEVVSDRLLEDLMSSMASIEFSHNPLAKVNHNFVKMHAQALENAR